MPGATRRTTAKPAAQTEGTSRPAHRVPVGRDANRAGNTTGATKGLERLAGHGLPLDHDTRLTMQDAFDSDFGDVRIHTGVEADSAARHLKARAFTSGSDIAFRTGAYDPDTDRGRGLLAHELAHVLQQRSASRRVDAASAHSSLERDARGASRSMHAGVAPISVARGATVPAVQRQSDDNDDTPNPRRKKDLPAEGLTERSKKSEEMRHKSTVGSTIGRSKAEGHHSLPKFLGGKRIQDLVDLPIEMHQAYHRELYDLLRRELKRLGKLPSGRISYKGYGKLFRTLTPAEQDEVLRKIVQHADEFDNRVDKKGVKWKRRYRSHKNRKRYERKRTLGSQIRKEIARVRPEFVAPRVGRAKSGASHESARSQSESKHGKGGASEIKPPRETPNARKLRDKIRKRAGQRGFAEVPFARSGSKAPATPPKGPLKTPKRLPRRTPTRGLGAGGGGWGTVIAIAMGLFLDYLTNKWITEPHIKGQIEKLQPEIERAITNFDGMVLAERALQNQRSYAVIRYSVVEEMSTMDPDGPTPDIYPDVVLESVGFSAVPVHDEQGQWVRSAEWHTVRDTRTYTYSVEIEPTAEHLDEFVVLEATKRAGLKPKGKTLPPIRTKKLQAHIRTRIREIDKLIEADPTSVSLQEERDAWAQLLPGLEPHIKREKRIAKWLKRKERRRRVSEWKKKAAAAKLAAKTKHKPAHETVNVEEYVPKKAQPFTIFQRPQSTIQEAAEAPALLQNWGSMLQDWGDDLRKQRDPSDRERRAFVKEVDVWMEQVLFWEAKCDAERRWEAVQKIAKLRQVSIGPDLTQRRTELDY